MQQRSPNAIRTCQFGPGNGLVQASHHRHFPIHALFFVFYGSYNRILNSFDEYIIFILSFLLGSEAHQKGSQDISSLQTSSLFGASHHGLVHQRPKTRMSRISELRLPRSPGPRAGSEGPDDPWDVRGAGDGGDHSGGDPAEGSGAATSGVEDPGTS